MARMLLVGRRRWFANHPARCIQPTTCLLYSNKPKPEQTGSMGAPDRAHARFRRRRLSLRQQATILIGQPSRDSNFCFRNLPSRSVQISLLCVSLHFELLTGCCYIRRLIHIIINLFCCKTRRPTSDGCCCRQQTIVCRRPELVWSAQNVFNLDLKLNETKEEEGELCIIY